MKAGFSIVIPGTAGLVSASASSTVVAVLNLQQRFVDFCMRDARGVTMYQKYFFVAVAAVRDRRSRFSIPAQSRRRYGTTFWIPTNRLLLLSVFTQPVPEASNKVAILTASENIIRFLNDCMATREMGCYKSIPSRLGNTASIRCTRLVEQHSNVTLPLAFGLCKSVLVVGAESLGRLPPRQW